jgi:hypothetical protein
MNRKLISFFMLSLLGWGCAAQTRASSVADMTASAAVAELDKKSVDVEDLLLDADQYLGKVVKLKYKGIRCYTSSSSSHLYVYGDDYNCRLTLSLPDDRDAREWVIDQAKDNDDYYYYDEVPGSSGSLYVYVGDKSFLAVGRRVAKSKGSLTYRW